jgi:diguanylate cyclase (GGDEF)-like protein/PAS domain S-box-containing protein
MMRQKKSNGFTLSIKYALLGGMFGMILPLLSTLNELYIHNLNYSWATIKQIHQSPLLWIIDSTPVFFGMYAYMAGTRQQNLVEQTEKLEELVEQRSKDIIRQKLFYEALVDNSPIAIVTLDQNQRIISINPAFQNLFGYRQDEVMGKELDSLIANPDRPQEAYNITQKVWEGNAIHEFGKRKCKNGNFVDVEIFGEQIRVNGSRIGVLGLYRDITAEKKAQEALSASEERFRLMFSDSPVALRMENYSKIKQWLDENFQNAGESLQNYLENNPGMFSKIASLAEIVDLNDATLWMYGAKSKEDLQEHIHEILGQTSRKEFVNIIESLLDGETTLERELVYDRLDGRKIYTITKLSIIPGYEKTWGRILFSNMDITERKLAEERLAFISLHDIMTGIYNRAFFEEEMSRLSRSRSYPISILIMDMDNLKAINDRHGHQAGDTALQAVAQIIRNCFRTEDVVARIGGDEFAVLLQEVDADGAQKAKERILNGIQNLNQTDDGRTVPLSLSIGCATVSSGEPINDAFNTADTLMYAEKKKKKESL